MLVVQKHRRGVFWIVFFFFVAFCHRIFPADLFEAVSCASRPTNSISLSSPIQSEYSFPLTLFSQQCVYMQELQQSEIICG